MEEVTEPSPSESLYLTSFYRIIMPSSLREHRLALPKKFVEEYGEQLSRTISLELPPVGDIWCIGLRKSGCLLWLQDGFENFIKHFSIGFGYFLLFKYKGNSEFRLYIFDLTATEIDYGHEFHSKSSTERLPAESTPTKKQKRITTCTELVLDQKEVVSNQLRGRARALHEAEMYKTDNPSCIFQLKGSNSYLLHLPRQFCREHNMEYAQVMELQDSADRKWRVRCGNKDARWDLLKGWSQFYKDKRLHEGDVCVFEILSKGILKVSIFHAK